MRLWGFYSSAVRAKPAEVTVVSNVIRDDCGCEAAALGSLGLFWVWVGCRMCFQGLGPRKPGPPARIPEIHLSSGSQGQGSMVTDVMGDACHTRTSSAPISPVQFLLFSP